MILFLKFDLVLYAAYLYHPVIFDVVLYIILPHLPHLWFFNLIHLLFLIAALVHSWVQLFITYIIELAFLIILLYHLFYRSESYSIQPHYKIINFILNSIVIQNIFLSNSKFQIIKIIFFLLDEDFPIAFFYFIQQKN